MAKTVIYHFSCIEKRIISILLTTLLTFDKIKSIFIEIIRRKENYIFFH